jgi:hypothetical protein
MLPLCLPPLDLTNRAGRLGGTQTVRANHINGNRPNQAEWQPGTAREPAVSGPVCGDKLLARVR